MWILKISDRHVGLFGLGRSMCPIERPSSFICGDGGYGALHFTPTTLNSLPDWKTQTTFSHNLSWLLIYLQPGHTRGLYNVLSCNPHAGTARYDINEVIFNGEFYNWTSIFYCALAN